MQCDLARKFATTIGSGWTEILGELTNRPKSGKECGGKPWKGRTGDDCLADRKYIGLFAHGGEGLAWRARGCKILASQALGPRGEAVSDKRQPNQVSLNIFDLVNSIFGDFRREWQAGKRPRLEDYLGAVRRQSC